MRGSKLIVRKREDGVKVMRIVKTDTKRIKDVAYFVFATMITAAGILTLVKMFGGI